MVQGCGSTELFTVAAPPTAAASYDRSNIAEVINDAVLAVEGAMNTDATGKKELLMQDLITKEKKNKN